MLDFCDYIIVFGGCWNLNLDCSSDCMCIENMNCRNCQCLSRKTSWQTLITSWQISRNRFIWLVQQFTYNNS